MTLAFELDHGVKMNQNAKYVGHLVQKLLFGHTDTHKHRTDCSTWVTKVVRSSVIICVLPRVATSQLVTRSSRHTVNSAPVNSRHTILRCDELTV